MRRAKMYETLICYIIFFINLLFIFNHPKAMSYVFFIFKNVVYERQKPLEN